MKQPELITYLSQFVTDHKKQLMCHIIQQRTRYITLVLEDIYQSQNAGAVLRTADCFGIQDVHVIEQRNKLKLSSVAMGAQKWLTIKKYKETQACLEILKKDGYRIVVTSPHGNAVSLPELDMNKKTALVFGNEETGVSDSALKHADITVKIPMVGFTESFNISVSAAICLYALTQKMQASDIDWHLNKTEREQVMLNWLRNTVNGAAHMEFFFTNSG